MIKKTLLIALLIASILLVAFTVNQNYEIDWWSLDGGGGTSSGDGFSISGIIGQQDAGPALTDGTYTAIGGYWAASLAPVQPANPKVLLPLLMN